MDKNGNTVIIYLIFTGLLIKSLGYSKMPKPRATSRMIDQIKILRVCHSHNVILYRNSKNLETF